MTQATLSDILRQLGMFLLFREGYIIFCYNRDWQCMQTLGTHFGLDLMHRKAEIKDIITEVINNMTDDEDEGDDEEAEDKADADDNEWEVNRIRFSSLI